MDRFKSNAFGQGHKDRGQNDQDRRDIHDHPHNQQQTDDQRNHGIAVFGKAKHRLCNQLWNALETHPPAKDPCKGDDDKNHPGDPRGAHQHPVKAFDGQSPVDKDTDEHSIGHRDRSRLGWRYDAAQNAAQNNHWHGQSRQRRYKCVPDLAGGCAAQRLWQVFAFAANRNDRHADSADHQARQDTGGKQTSNRHPHQRPIDNHQSRWRNGGPNDRTSRGHGASVVALVTLFHHRWHQGAPKGSRICGGRSRQARKEHRSQHIGMRQPAAKPSHQHLGQFHQPVGDANVIHDFAGENEKRHGKKGKDV